MICHKYKWRSARVLRRLSKVPNIHNDTVQYLKTHTHRFTYITSLLD